MMRREFKKVLFVALCLLPASSGFSQVIPFAFLRAPPPSFSWDFTALSSLPSILTLTRSSTATYVNSSGLIQSAAANVPRFDYDLTTGEAQGLLLEPAATNINVCSETINVSTCWNTEGANAMTTTQNVAVAPDGNTTAERLNGFGDSWVYAGVPTTTQNVPYVFSVYLKAPSTAGTVKMSVQEAAGAYQTWSQQVVNVTTSWKRFYITGTKTNTNPMRFLIYMGPGNLSQVYAWGAQVELGTVPTSYIPTPSTSSVTRAADTLTFNSMAWFNANAGTLYAEYVNLRTESAASYRVFGVYNTNAAGTFAQNSIEIADNNTTVTSNVTVSSAAQFSPGGSVNAAGTINRQALTYATNAFTSSINQGSVTTDTSGSLPNPAYGYIGSQPDGNIRSRYIRKIQYYSTNIKNQQLIDLH